jgi:hemoglobin
MYRAVDNTDLAPGHTGPMSDAETLYERVGGMAFFDQLVERFYTGVAEDQLLRPMYPEDLGPARTRLSLFIAQYFGGPDDYDKLRGHPRLRMRHFPFPIDHAARDAWLKHMEASLDQAQCQDEDREQMRAYFRAAADFLVNRGGLSIVGNPEGGR